MNQDQTRQLTERIQAAAAAAEGLDIRGSGSKSFLGRAPAGTPLEVTDHAGVVNYQPKELIITVRGGTPLSEIEETLAEQDQMLPFEPPHFGPGATIGGTIACGLSGPARPYRGAARDLVLGTRILNGRAQVLRFGGEVMKNVAGYDVSRLMAGAYGTLGLLLEISLKVLPVPAAERTLVQERTPAEAIELTNRWAGKPLPVTANCYDGERFFLRLAGAETAVAQAATDVGGEVVEDGDSFWRDKIREQGHAFFAGGLPLWRISLPLSLIHISEPTRPRLVSRMPSSA